MQQHRYSVAVVFGLGGICGILALLLITLVGYLCYGRCKCAKPEHTDAALQVEAPSIIEITCHTPDNHVAASDCRECAATCAANSRKLDAAPGVATASGRRQCPLTLTAQLMDTHFTNTMSDTSLSSHSSYHAGCVPDRQQHRSTGLGRLPPGTSQPTSAIDDNQLQQGSNPLPAQPLVTLVVTDVEGSTALWEAIPESMDMALEVHDACLRALMLKHGGHEVSTEGDSFTVAFHRAVDAVQWCLDVQEALLHAKWSRAVLQHPAALPLWTPLSGGGAKDILMSTSNNNTLQLLCSTLDDHLGHSDPPIFRGLRVRMGVCTSASYIVARHPVTGSWEYHGHVRAVAEAISDAGYGGQILMCQTTCQEVSSRLTTLVGAGNESIELIHNQALATCPSLDHHTTPPAAEGTSHSLSRLQRSATPPTGGNSNRSITRPHSPQRSSTSATTLSRSTTTTTSKLHNTNTHSPSSGATIPSSYFAPFDPVPSSQFTVSTPPGPASSHSLLPLPPAFHSPGSPRAAAPDQPSTVTLSGSPLTQLSQPIPCRTKARRNSLVELFSPRGASSQKSCGITLASAPAGRAISFTLRRNSKLRLHRCPSDSALADETDSPFSDSDMPDLEDELLNTICSATRQSTPRGSPRKKGCKGSSPGFDDLCTSMSIMSTSCGATNQISSAEDAPPATPTPALPGAGVLLLDMGRYRLQEEVAPGPAITSSSQQHAGETHITQVIAQALTARLQHWPTALQLEPASKLGPGYFDAAGAAASVRHIGLQIPSGLRPKITVAFCSLPRETAVALTWMGPGKSPLLEQFQHVVRATIKAMGGYECQEQGGTFMVAFHRMRPALEWSLLLQLALLQVRWDLDSFVCGHKKLPEAGEVRGEGGELLFRGIRARVGIMHGEVLKVTPHSRTGRADYFGQLLNRAARLQGAAHGGQVLAEGLAADRALQECRLMYPQQPSTMQCSQFLPGRATADGPLAQRASSLLPLPPASPYESPSCPDPDSTYLSAQSIMPLLPSSPTPGPQPYPAAPCLYPDPSLPPCTPGSSSRNPTQPPAPEPPLIIISSAQPTSPNTTKPITPLSAALYGVCDPTSAAVPQPSAQASRSSNPSLAAMHTTTLRTTLSPHTSASSNTITNTGASNTTYYVRGHPRGQHSHRSSLAMSAAGSSATHTTSGLPLVAVAVDIHDRGVLAFKGVEGTVPVSCFIPSLLGGRATLVPATLPTRKARIVRPGTGHMDSVLVLLPDPNCLDIGIRMPSLDLPVLQPYHGPAPAALFPGSSGLLPHVRCL